MEAMRIKDKRGWINFLYHVSVIVISLGMIKLGCVTGFHVMIRFGIFVLIAHVLSFRILPVSRFIQEALIKRAGCTVCGAEVELENLYQCSCGYTQVRHAFSPCPMCGTEFQWITCPECGSSIAI